MAFIFVIALLIVLAIVTPALPVLIEQSVGSHSRAAEVNGIFVAVWAAVQFLIAPVFGVLSDRLGRRPMILLMTAGLAINYLIMALEPGLGWLALGRVLVGATSAAFTTVYAYIADTTPPQQRARAYGLIGAGLSGGFVAGPLLDGLLWRLSSAAQFWAAGAVSAAALVYGVIFLKESLAREHRAPFSWNRANPFGAMKLLWQTRELSLLALINFLVYFAFYALVAVFVLYASHRYRWSTSHVAALFAAIGLLDMVVQGVLVGALTKRYGDRYTMTIGLFGGAMGLVAMGLAPTGPLFALALVIHSLRGLSVATLQSLMTRRVAEEDQGQLQGANMSIVSIAGVLSPLLAGAIYATSVSKETNISSSSGTAFLFAALVLLIAAVVSCFVSRGHSAEPRCESKLA